MNAANVTVFDVWGVFLNDPLECAMMRQALMCLQHVSVKKLQQAIRCIDTETSIGPLFHPSAYVDGSRFTNAREYTEALRAAIALRNALPKLPSDVAG